VQREQTFMDQCTYPALGGQGPPSMRSVNGDMRRAAANLAFIINACGLSQSELSRRSGVSRQLINGWARQRVSVTLSSTVGQLLAGLQLTLADLLLDEAALAARLGVKPGALAPGAQILPHLVGRSQDPASRQRLELVVGAFRYKTRLKDAPMFVLERLFVFEPDDGEGLAVKVYEDVRAGNKTFAEGHCFHRQSMFFVTIECVEPPHQPMVFAFRDPQTSKIRSLNGVSIAPDWFGPHAGCPLARLVYLYRTNPDGTPISVEGFNPDVEFSTFIPPDACSVITTY
jgi:transcriptional regulator with XRE-family HTH domain